MVIELSGVQFGLKSYAEFNIKLSSIWNQKNYFRPKFHDTKSRNFINFILNLVYDRTENAYIASTSRCPEWVVPGAGLLNIAEAKTSLYLI